MFLKPIKSLVQRNLSTNTSTSNILDGFRGAVGK